MALLSEIHPRRLRSGRGGCRVWAATLVALATLAPPALAQVPLPPLPPIGGQPPIPPGERPPPEQPPPPGPVSQAPGSVTRHVDVAHSGHLSDDQLVPPLVPRWNVSGLKPTRVLAAAGRVYVVNSSGVVTLDASDGRELWRAAPAGGVQGAAFDDNRLFVSTRDDLHALNAETGASLWQKHLADLAYVREPIASGGVVYVSTAEADEKLYALRASDGVELWRSDAPEASVVPTLDNERIYLGANCGHARALDRANGALLWSHASECGPYDDGSVTAALHGGRLYVPGGGDSPVLDSSDGKVVGRFEGRLPIFVDGLALYMQYTTTRAVELASGREVWRMNAAGRAIAVGHDVYILQTDQHSGTVRGTLLTARDAETGRDLWTTELPRARDSALLAAAPGLLLVSTGSRLVAYESALKPEPRGIALGVPFDEVLAGRRAIPVGVLGAEIRDSRPQTTVETARWRKGDFRRTLSTRPLRDGGFASRVRVVRNTRLRARGGGATSNEVTVYAWPTVRLGRPYAVGAGRAVRHAVVVRAPATRLGGRTFALYLDRYKTKGLRLLGMARLRGGRTARGVMRYRDLPGFHRRDLVWWCIRGQLSIDLGRPSSLTKRCGRRTLPEPE